MYLQLNLYKGRSPTIYIQGKMYLQLIYIICESVIHRNIMRSNFAMTRVETFFCYKNCTDYLDDYV